MVWPHQTCNAHQCKNSFGVERTNLGNMHTVERDPMQMQPRQKRIGKAPYCKNKCLFMRAGEGVGAMTRCGGRHVRDDPGRGTCGALGGVDAMTVSDVRIQS